MAYIKRITAALTLALSTLAIAGSAPQEGIAPTQEHVDLLKSVGTWEGTLKWFMPEPGEAPCREVVEAIGPYWTQTRFECTFMGQAYVGTGATGYDPSAQKYRGTWIDSASTYLAIMEGEMDEAAGGIVMRWKAPDMTGAVTDHRSVTTSDGAHYTSTFYMGPGDGMKVMEMEMKKVAKAPSAK